MGEHRRDEPGGWRRIMSVNLDGVFIVSKAVGKIMIKQGQGSIVNTSSMSGVIVNSRSPKPLITSPKPPLSC